jgi:hypothetical protein
MTFPGKFTLERTLSFKDFETNLYLRLGERTMIAGNILTPLRVLGCSLVLVLSAWAQTDTRQGSAPAGAGVFVAGDYWDGITPDNIQPYSANRWWRETLGADALNNHTFIHMGNQDRLWNVPTTMWPGGWNYGQYWAHNMRLVEYDSTSLFPTSPHSSPNSANYAFGTFGSNLAGASDPLRNYSRVTKWVDDTKRTQTIYEVGFPTSMGIDVQVVARQFTVNWSNLNDFIIVEITLKNTGVVDLNKDGAAERTGNAIKALNIGWNGTPMVSYFLTTTGGRGNDFNVGRNSGYVGDNDPTGSPWDMVVSFPGVDPTRVNPDRTVAAGRNNAGVNGAQTLKSYTDVWTFNSFLAVKRGSGNPANPDKPTIFGTHPIGIGAERGWYHSVMQGNGIGGFGADSPPTGSTPEGLHKLFMGAFYQNAGKDNNAANQNFSPNSNYFLSGTPGNPLSFVPKVVGATRPNGDRKLLSDEIGLSAFSQGPWEDGSADATTNYPTGYGNWTKGFVFEHTFGGDIMNAVGPFSIPVDSSITVVWVHGGGYRLEGVQKALEAARWAYANAWGAAPGGYNETVLPTPPPAPHISVSGAPSGKSLIRWDNRAEADPDFAGYKIWRAQPFPRFTTISGGMRGMDRYQEQMTLGETGPTLLKPVNPKFDAFSEVQTLQQADSWGPYRLVAVIPEAQLGNYTSPSTPFTYAYEDVDSDVLQGFTYWYYVSAYAEKTGGYTGPGGATTSRIESHKVNVNGRSGLWMGTYPFANSLLNPFFPRDLPSQKALGSAFVLSPDVPSAASVASGQVKIFVKPNPYKRTALFDVGLEHKVAFNNIPDQSTITILDVAGQIVFQQKIQNPTNGAFVWDLFSKDGMEVANGVYIYIVEYPGGREVNYLSILR